MSKNTLALIASLLITLSASAEDMKLKYESCDMGVKNHADAWEQVYNSLIENSNNAIVMKKPEQSVVINDMSSYNATMMKDESHNWVATPEAVKKYGYYTPLREFEWSTVPLIAFGFAAKANKKNFRAARNNFIPAYENRFVNDDCYTVKQIAAPYHLKPGDLNSFLCDRHVQRKVGRSYVLEPKYRGKGYTADRRRYYFNADGQLHYKVEMLWTAKGREFVEKEMRKLCK